MFVLPGEQSHHHFYKLRGRLVRRAASLAWCEGRLHSGWNNLNHLDLALQRRPANPSIGAGVVRHAFLAHPLISLNRFAPGLVLHFDRALAPPDLQCEVGVLSTVNSFFPDWSPYDLRVGKDWARRCRSRW